MAKKETDMIEVENMILKSNKAERECSDKTYARKEVEKILIWVGAIFGAAILMAIAKLIIK
jgi:hypothetical protein